MSNKGNDQNNGTSKSKPWQTLNALKNKLSHLQAGDSVYFERGSEFLGSFKIALKGREEKSIYFGAYGTGEKPIIKGSVPLSNWSLVTKNIWVTKWDQEEPTQLFINEKSQHVGRYPDSGYRTITINNTPDTFIDSTLSSKDNYWDNAEAVIRTSRWTIDKINISNFTKNQFTLSGSPSYSLENGFGYFIQKHIDTLNQQGEWYFDKSSKKIYLYLNESTRPENLKIEVSQQSSGLIIDYSEFIQIADLEFRNYQQSGIQLTYSNSISITHVTINYSAKNGIETSNCRKPVIKHCQILNSGNNGVEWTNNEDGQFIKNGIRNTGMIVGQGESGNGTYIGLMINNAQIKSHNSFLYNRIDSTGYIGIDFRGGGNLIKNNFIQNFCLLKDDGAGIYTWGNDQGSNIIDGNIIMKGKGNSDGTKNSLYYYANGIYIDDNSNDIIVQNNTIAYCAQSGIFIHNASGIKIISNTLLKNGNHFSNKEKGELYIRQDELQQVKSPLALEVSQNKFIASESSSCMYFWLEKKENLIQTGKFSSNEYFSSTPNLLMAFYSKQTSLCEAPESYSLKDWQDSSGQDNQSVFKIIPSDYKPTVNLLTSSKADDWITWPEGSNAKSMNESDLSLSITPAPTSEVLLYHAGFRLNKNTTYRLSFSARSDSPGTMEFVPMVANAPWTVLDKYTCFTLSSNFKNFNYLFTVNKEVQEGRLNFKNNQRWQIRNVSLEEVQYNPATFNLVFNDSDKEKRVDIEKRYSLINDSSHSSSIVLLPYTSAILVNKSGLASSKLKK